MEAERKELFIQSHDKTIREILNTGSYHYVVPDFQRPYSWNTTGSQRQQVIDLWDDLMDIIESKNRDFHFMGAMIFAKKPGDAKTRIIIDGQQRLLTLTIIFAAMRDVIFEIISTNRRADPKIKDYLERLALRSIHERIIAGFDETSGEEIPLIDPHPDDRDFFLNFIVRYRGANGDYLLFREKKREWQRLRGSNDVMPSHVKMWKAYEYSYRQIRKLLFRENRRRTRDLQEIKDQLQNLFSILMDSLQVIATQAKNEEDAHVIFETLNDRGVELTVTDLIRNYIFSKATTPELRDHIRNQWEQIKNNTMGKMDTFLRYYYMIFNGKARKKGLYKQLKDLLEPKIQKQGVRETLNELVWYSRVYRILMDPPEKVSKKSQIDMKIISLLLEHKIFGVQQDLPLLMVAYRLYENNQKEEFAKILEFTNSVIVRYLKLLSNSPSSLEKLYGGLAYELNTLIESGGYQSFEIFIRQQISEKESLKEFLDTIQNDDLIKSQLKQSPITPERAKEILIALTNREKGIIADPNEVSLEHILPQNPSEDWIRAIFGNTVTDKEIIEKQKELELYINNIGNLTLISIEDNRHIGNALYSEKIKHYLSSAYPLTKEIPQKYPRWDINAIMDRAEELSEKILSTWKIKL